jgi:hypothetical protein
MALAMCHVDRVTSDGTFRHILAHFGTFFSLSTCGATGCHFCDGLAAWRVIR